MNSACCLWLGVGGFVLTILAALAEKFMQESAWHELKDYCRRRNRRDRFDTIFDQHEATLLGLESLRVVALLLLIAGAIGWYVHQVDGTPDGDLPPALLDWRAPVAFFVTLLVLAVWLPAAIAESWSEVALFHAWPAIHFASRCMIPFSWGALALQAAFRRMGGEEEESEEEAFEDEVLAIVTEGMHDGHLEADAREMIEGVIELGDGDVADIMTPRSKMDAIPIVWEWDRVLQFVTSCGRTRIPVYADSLDHILGILYVKDLLAELSQNEGRPKRTLRSLLRDPWYVPPTQGLDDLLQDFRQTRNHLAIVRDEFSRVAGLVTIEDVLEEIVGEIVDETDKEHVEEIRCIDERTAVIQGRAHLAEINEIMGLELPEPDDFDTIAGYVINHLGRIPKTGEEIFDDHVRITVLKASKRKIESVKLEAIP